MISFIWVIPKITIAVWVIICVIVSVISVISVTSVITSVTSVIDGIRVTTSVQSDTSLLSVL
jgi:hypothetical protein